jgi:hypothetical protein
VCRGAGGPQVSGRGFLIVGTLAALAVAGCGAGASSPTTVDRLQATGSGKSHVTSAGGSPTTSDGRLHAKSGGGSRTAARAQSSYHTKVEIGGRPSGRPLPNNYLGFALTYKPIPGWVGPPSGSVDPVLVQLIRNLVPRGRPLLRIGGESADHSWWPIPGYRKPFGITYDLAPSWTTAARRLAQAAHARLMLGLNLQADRPKLIKVEAHELLRRIGAKYIQSFQIGNEPDLYSVIPWYKLLNGHPVPRYSKVGTPVYARPPTYDPADFAAEVHRMLRVMPKFPIAGPETNTPAWIEAFTRFLHPAGRAVTLTTHAYGGNACVKDPKQWMFPSVAHLLSLPASRDQLAGIDHYIGAARRHGDGFRVDELGTITCSGRYGVSNSMASALWVLDTLFSMDDAGVTGVNLHSVKGANELFDPKRTHGHWQTSVGPWYYGALMFTQAAPAGSRLLSVTHGTQAHTRTWATLGRDHIVRVLVINDSVASSARVLVHISAGYGHRLGTLELLRARSAYATSGLSLGGRSFGLTTTGVLRPSITRPVRRRDGAYAVTLPPASAGLLTLAGG